MGEEYEYKKINLDELPEDEGLIESVQRNEQDEQEDNVVYVQEPEFKIDDTKGKKRTRRKKKDEIKKDEKGVVEKVKPPKPKLPKCPERVNPKHWRIALTNRNPFERGEG